MRGQREWTHAHGDIFVHEMIFAEHACAQADAATSGLDEYEGNTILIIYPLF